MALLTRNDMDRLWDVEEVADYIGVTSRTVWRWIEQDGLPAIRINRTTRFRRAEVERWIDERRAA